MVFDALETVPTIGSPSEPNVTGKVPARFADELIVIVEQVAGTWNLMIEATFLKLSDVVVDSATEIAAFANEPSCEAGITIAEWSDFDVAEAGYTAR
jgi:hypothetical protein